MTGFGIAAVVAGWIRGNLAAAWGRKPVFLAGLLSAGLANLVIYAEGRHLSGLLVGVILLGLGFMLAYSAFLTIATEFGRAARGPAMSLVAFCFMGGTALGSNFISAAGFAAFSGVTVWPR